MQATEKKMGKKLYVLESFVRKDGQDVKDGYLLFSGPEKTGNIIEMCEIALNDNTNRPFKDQSQAFYKAKDWILAKEFYANQVNQRGSFFVRKLEDAILDENDLLIEELIEMKESEGDETVDSAE